MERQFKAFIFDVDDTLYPVAEVLVKEWKANRSKLAAFGVDATELSNKYLELQGTRPARETLIDSLIEIGADPSFAKRIKEVADVNVPETLTLHVGVKSMLHSLKSQGIKIAVLTNGKYARQEAKLHALNIRHLIDEAIVCDGANWPYKPLPEAFLNMSDLLGYHPSEICMVGDRLDNDILPAVELGMHAIHVRQGNHKFTSAVEGIFTTEDPQTAWHEVLRLAAPNAISIPMQRSERETQLV